MKFVLEWDYKEYLVETSQLNLTLRRLQSKQLKQLAIEVEISNGSLISQTFLEKEETPKVMGVKTSKQILAF
jgi:hypothetical protein